MTNIRYINSKIWQKNWFLEIDSYEKLVYIFLLSNQYSNIIGVYQVSIKLIEVFTKINNVEPIFKKLKNINKIDFYENWIFIKDFSDYQPFKGNKMKQTIEKIFKEIPRDVIDNFGLVEKEFIDFVMLKKPINGIRKEIFERDGYKCVKCNSKKYLELDHIIPVSKGGKSVRSNYQTLCQKCNIKKSNKL